MHLLDSIEAQLISNRLPLVAVTLAAVPYANTPLVLTLHWHGFVETRLAEVTDANVVAYQAVPSSALQINERWDRFDELENEVLDVAWELGSWDLARTEALPFVRPGADEQESLECMNAFGSAALAVDGQAPVAVRIEDARGRLTHAKSEKILADLRRKSPDTGLFERHIAIEEALAANRLTVGNKVTLLQDGQATYPAMLAVIRSAKHHVHM